MRKPGRMPNPECEPTKFIYRYPDQCTRLPLDVQRKILRMYRIGFPVEVICTETKLHRNTIKILLDRGIVFCDPDEKRRRCSGCGAKLLAVPCMTCEVRKVIG